MKKLLSIILSILILIPNCIVLASDNCDLENSKFDFGNAYQFTEGLKELENENFDSSLRLIVTSNKQIDYLDAFSIVTGIDNLYVLQFDNEISFNKAYEYYTALPYVRHVEFDTGFEYAICEAEENFDFIPACISTVKSNIDDAIKLMHKKKLDTKEIKVGIIDSGIALTSFTKNRVEGGCSFLDGYEENGIHDKLGHGTKVAGTVIQNSTDNIKLYSYQIIDSSGRCSLLDATAAIYQAIEDGCKILNCSFGKSNNGTLPQYMASAVEAAIKSGVFIIASAGNDSTNMENINQYPAQIDGVLTVGAITQTNKLASFSNFGEGIDIYATGQGMTSYDNSGNEIVSWSGTSASAPVISSICALLVTAKPDITVDE
ncbi:MAG: S8 family peptidase, partial [Eubacterium sp.]